MHGIEEIFGRNIISLSKKKQELYLNAAFHYWRTKGFPYEEITKAEVYAEYKRLENTDCRSILRGKIIKSSTIALRLANSFHSQMWHISSQGHHESPIDHFNNDATLRKLLARAVRFWPNRNCWKAYNIRNIFRIYSGGRISNFRPTASKTIIDRFSEKNALILDFCSGFGGRLLGAITLQRHYIGIDVSPRQVKGLKNMYDAVKPFSKGSAEFYNGCAEDIMRGMESGSYDLIFTSPPYFDLERYSTTTDQSYLRYSSYQSWKENFLEPVIAESHRLLKNNGFFVVNIANTRRYSLATDFEDISRKHFRFSKKYHLEMNARPVQRKDGNSYKLEPIYVYQKKDQ